MMKVSLTATKGPLQGRKFEFENAGEYLIGRATECHIPIPQHLENLDISRHHCLLDIDPPVIRIRDLGSRNGTYINGCKIGQRRSDQAPEDADLAACAYCRVVQDDEIRVGHTEFRVSISAMAEQPAGHDSDSSIEGTSYIDAARCVSGS